MTGTVFVDVGASVVVDRQTVKYQTCMDSRSFLVAIHEKLRRSDYAVFTPEPCKHGIQIFYLSDGVGSDRLLPVSESGVRDVDMLGHRLRNESMVENHFRHFVVSELVFKKIWLFDVLQFVAIGFFFKQIAFVGQIYHILLPIFRAQSVRCAVYKRIISSIAYIING